jgi:hypothetical protein
MYDDDRLAELVDQAEQLADRIYQLWWAEKVRTPRYHRLLALSHRADARMFRRKDALKAVAP